MSYYRQQLEEWLATREVKADVVYDVGGAQGSVQSRVKSWDVNHYKILDLPDYDVERRANMPKRYVQADVIFCLEVFEYLIDPLAAFGNLRNILKYDGSLFATFAFVYPHHNELAQDSLRYTQSGIIRLADKVRLKIANIWYRTDRSGLLQQFYSEDGMRQAKQYPHHGVTGFIVEFTK